MSAVTLHGGLQLGGGKTPPAPLGFRAQHTHTYAALDGSTSLHQKKKKKDYIKGDIKRRESGSETRVCEIIPARMKAGEPSREASIHAKHARWKEEKKTSPQIKSVPAQVDIWSGSPDARRRYQTARRCSSRAAGVIFCLFQGRLSSWLSAFR